MNNKDKEIINQFKREREIYLDIEKIVYEAICDEIEKNKVFVMEVSHRTKNVDSLKNKVIKKSGKYDALQDITDLCGIRIITYFSDDVDTIGRIVTELFDVDESNSIDKREALNATQFGYLSLHYVCALPIGKGYSSQLVGRKFEIQIRTVLQHTWAEIEHDLGYKSEFGVPRELRREFSRIAGLLEIADGQFVSLRDNLKKYSDNIKEKINSDDANDVLIDRISLEEYMHNNTNMQRFLKRISSELQIEVEHIDSEAYIELFELLEFESIGDISHCLEENGDLAFEMIKEMIESTGLDILSTNAALRYLCRAYIIKNRWNRERIAKFVGAGITNKERINEQTDVLIETMEKYYGANK